MLHIVNRSCKKWRNCSISPCGPTAAISFYTLLSALALSPVAGAQTLLLRSSTLTKVFTDQSLVIKARVECRVYNEGNRRVTVYCHDGYECAPDDKCRPGFEMRQRMEREREEKMRAANEELQRIRQEQERALAEINRARREAQRFERRASEQNSRNIPSPRYDMGRYNPNGRPMVGARGDSQNIPSPQYGAPRPPQPVANQPMQRQAAQQQRQLMRVLTEWQPSKIPQTSSSPASASQNPAPTPPKRELFGSIPVASSRLPDAPSPQNIYVSGQLDKSLAQAEQEKASERQQWSEAIVEHFFNQNYKPNMSPAERNVFDKHLEELKALALKNGADVKDFVNKKRLATGQTVRPSQPAEMPRGRGRNCSTITGGTLGVDPQPSCAVSTKTWPAMSKLLKERNSTANPPTPARREQIKNELVGYWLELARNGQNIDRMLRHKVAAGDDVIEAGEAAIKQNPGLVQVSKAGETVQATDDDAAVREANRAIADRRSRCAVHTTFTGSTFAGIPEECHPQICGELAVMVRDGKKGRADVPQSCHAEIDRLNAPAEFVMMDEPDVDAAFKQDFANSLTINTAAPGATASDADDPEISLFDRVHQRYGSLNQDGQFRKGKAP